MTLTMKSLTLLSALALSASFAQAVNAGQLNGTNVNPQISTKSMSGLSNGGQWRTLSNGCSYSRAQAPGYAPTWHLIVNPQTVGLPTPKRRCKGMVQG